MKAFMYKELKMYYDADHMTQVAAMHIELWL